MPKRAPLTTPRAAWQAAVRRRTQFYLLVAFLLAVLFGVLVFQFFIQQQVAGPQVLTQAVFANQNIPMGTTITPEMRRIELAEMRFIELAEMVTVTPGNKNLETFANHLTSVSLFSNS